MIREFEMLGMRVHGMNAEDACSAIAASIEHSKRTVIAHHNLHSLYLLNRSDELRALHAAAEYIHIDGMPVVTMGKALGLSLSRADRMTSLDWSRVVLDRAATAGWRVFFVGGKPGVAEAGCAELRTRYPGLKIDHTHGYFDRTEGSLENEAVLARIKEFQPHLLLVGMGMPIQEAWILANLSRLEANVTMPIGAFMDYIAGIVPTPPRWMGRVGLEWFHRLVTRPHQMFSRYLVEPWFVIALFVREFVRVKLIRKIRPVGAIVTADLTDGVAPPTSNSDRAAVSR